MNIVLTVAVCLASAHAFLTAPTTAHSRAGSMRALAAQASKGAGTAEKFESPLAQAASSNFGFQLATAALDQLFKVEPLFEKAKTKARAKIIARAESLGEDWHQHVADFENSMDELQAHYDNLLDPQVVATTPDYYKSPFHAYKEGNLNWQAAMEVEVSSLAVHSNIYTEDPSICERTGDDRLRNSFLERTAAVLKEAGASPPTVIADLGCSTGLSTLAIAKAFPSAATIQ
eukprot:4979-Heterococcus_DN1.PRE.1